MVEWHILLFNLMHTSQYRRIRLVVTVSYTLTVTDKSQNRIVLLIQHMLNAQTYYGSCAVVIVSLPGDHTDYYYILFFDSTVYS